VIFTLNNPRFKGDAFEKKMAENSVMVSAFGKDTIRLVTHLDFTEEMLQKTVTVLKMLDK
jgi:threonine aldolase